MPQNNNQNERTKELADWTGKIATAHHTFRLAYKLPVLLAKTAVNLVVSVERLDYSQTA